MKKRSAKLLLSIFFGIISIFAYSHRILALSNETTPAAVVLSSYQVSEGSLLAGERITLGFMVKNTSSTDSVADITLTYLGNENTLYPVFGETNSSYIPVLLPGESREVKKKFNISDISPETVVMNIIVQNREFGTTGYNKVENKIYLPIFGHKSLNTSLSVGNLVYKDSPVMISGYCTNAGSHDLFGLTAEFSGEISGEKFNVLLGDVQKGGQVSLQQKVLFEHIGTDKSLFITFSFLDKDGNNYQLATQKYLVTVLEAPLALKMSETKTTTDISRFFVPVLLFLVVVLILGAVYVYIKNRGEKGK